MLAFSLLSLAAFVLFVPRPSLYKDQVSAILALVALVIAYWQGSVMVIGLLFSGIGAGLLMGSLWIPHNSLRRVSAVSLVIFALALALHIIPGFENEPLYLSGLISPDALVYTLYANFDKALAGFLLAAYVLTQSNRERRLSTVKQSFAPVLAVVVLLPFLLMGLAYQLGLVTWDPKIPDIWVEFILVNLFAACLAEEALFRGVMQKLLARIWPNKAWLGIIIASVLFGLAHFVGGIEYILVATVAGFGYGYVFYKTQKLSWAIFSHFMVNLLHFFGFTYPMLA